METERVVKLLVLAIFGLVGVIAGLIWRSKPRSLWTKGLLLSFPWGALWLMFASWWKITPLTIRSCFFQGVAYGIGFLLMFMTQLHWSRTLGLLMLVGGFCWVLAGEGPLFLSGEQFTAWVFIKLLALAITVVGFHLLAGNLLPSRSAGTKR